MSTHFKRNYLQHALVVGEWIARNGARGGIDARSQVLEISCKGKTQRFYPQFVIENADGSSGFAPRMLLNVSGFVGWRPDQGKQWPAAQDKLEFKALAASQGIRTPKWTQNTGDARGAVLVKARRSTFGRGQRGPFQCGAALAQDLALAAGEYCEQFIVGRLVKAWFCDDQLAAAEVVDMPTVRGDGESSLPQLLRRQLAWTGAVPTGLAALAAYQGLNLEQAVGQGVSVLADYRYLSVLNPALTADFNVRDKLRGTPIEAALLNAARQVWLQLPGTGRHATVFTLDGVIDRDGTLWFLEANCNPGFHPAVYDCLLDRLFLAVPESAPGPARASAPTQTH